MRGHFAKAKVEPKAKVGEFRVDEDAVLDYAVIVEGHRHENDVMPVPSPAVDDIAEDAELWRTDGTTAGTVLVTDIRPGPLSSSPGSFANLGGVLFFKASGTVTVEGTIQMDGRGYLGGAGSSGGRVLDACETIARPKTASARCCAGGDIGKRRGEHEQRTRSQRWGRGNDGRRDRR